MMRRENVAVGRVGRAAGQFISIAVFKSVASFFQAAQNDCLNLRRRKVAVELRRENGEKALKKGFDHRARDKGGEIRHRRRDTMAKTLRAEYGERFAKGFKPDAMLGAVLTKTSAESLRA
jgi:hypothetical protein